MVKQWKANPPGEEQLMLDDMFDQGAIEDHETAATVQARVPLFHKFSDRVFAVHFAKTRGRFGYFAKPAPAVCNSIDKIPELGQIGMKASSSTQARKRPSSSHEVNNLCFNNAPYIVWVYADHEKQNEIVCVAIPVISGARDVDFYISEDNITLNITYVWPSALCSPEELFKKQLAANGGWTIHHPKIHSFKTRLLELELSKNSQPPASIEIKLPMKVQRESHTYVKAGVKTDNGNVVMLEFQAFQKQHVIEDSNTKIIFD